MTDRPITFSAPMVRALLGGRKSQTRRVLKHQPGFLDRPFQMDDGSWHVVSSSGDHMSELDVPYAPGDRLWVREAFRFDEAWDRLRAGLMLSGETIRYEADGHIENNTRLFQPGRYRHARFMPRRFSRITLIVTEVRVMQLQEITAEDCTAEGIPLEADALAPYEWSVSRFADLWTKLHGPGAWDSNPWVAAISFTTHRTNIDAIEAKG